MCDVCVCVCACIYACMYMHVCACLCVCVHVCICVCMCMFVCVCVYVCMCDVYIHVIDMLHSCTQDNGTAADNSVTDFEETSDDVYASNPVPVASSVAVEEELLHVCVCACAWLVHISTAVVSLSNLI